MDRALPLALPIGLIAIAVGVSLLSSEQLGRFSLLTLMIAVGAFMAMLENRQMSIGAYVERGALGELAICAAYALAAGVFISAFLLGLIVALGQGQT